MHTLKDKAVYLVKPYVNQGLAKSRATQIPFQAHTSNNAKAGIGASLFLSVLALVGVGSLVAHGVAKRASVRYREVSDEAIEKVGRKVGDKASEVKQLVDKEVSKKRRLVRNAADAVEETAEKASK